MLVILKLNMNITPIINKIRTISYYLLPAILIAIYLLIKDGDIYAEMGEIALNIFIAIMFSKPLIILSRQMKWRKYLVYRKDLGIYCFWFFAFHMFGLMRANGIEIQHLFMTPSNNFLFWGAMGGIGVIILGVTSNNASMKLLKKNWKRLHSLAYPAFFFGLYHSSLAEGEIAKFYLLGGLFIIAKVLEKLEIKRVIKAAESRTQSI